jgi:CRP-like cAMP-binding protein
MRKNDVEIIKVEIPKVLAEKFRKYVAEKYGLRRGSITKAIIDLIEEKLAETKKPTTDTVDNIVGLGLEADYLWNGEDLVEALRKRIHVLN